MVTQDSGRYAVGRVLGIVIFAIGVVLLIVVFALAAITFGQLARAMANPPSVGPGIPTVLAVAGVRAVFLLVMAYVSSLLASKGLDLFTAAKSEGPS